jgi:nicotinamide phosphoribosyltransferase
MDRNLVADTDAYKLTHPWQYPNNLDSLYSYGESRLGSKYPWICFFGLSGIVQDHLLQPITKEMIEEAEEEAFMTFGTTKYFAKEIWEKVMKLGYLPIRIRSVREGTKLPISNALFTLERTEKWFTPVMNSLEGTLMHAWYPTTVCTRAMYIKEHIKPIFAKSCDYPELILPFAVNDFGYRGGTCHEASARGGAAFLVHFEGSDNMAANRFIKQFYNMKGRLKSVWATEHSVATSFGPGQGEYDYINHQLDNCPQDKICSIVIDSYDDVNFINNVVGSEEIKNKIIARPGRVVFRPDTGKPINNVVEHSDRLAAIFGFGMNQKGYKVLHHNVGLLQGDGMDEDSIPETYAEYIKTGWGAENFITGSGGGLLQVGLNRDTQRFAIKAAYGEKDGVPFNIQKSPKGDMSKASKSGRLKLHRTSNEFFTIQSSKENPEQFNGYSDEMITILENGKFTQQNFADIIELAK